MQGKEPVVITRCMPCPNVPRLSVDSTILQQVGTNQVHKLLKGRRHTLLQKKSLEMDFFFFLRHGITGH